MTSWASPSSRRVREEAFAGHRSQLGEPGDLRLRPRLPRVVGVRGAAPQPERGLQRAHRLPGRLARRRLDRRLEGPRVHGVGREPQHVARTGAGDDAVALPGRRVGLEPPAQVAHVGLQRAGRVGGRVVTPDAVDQSIGRDHLVPQDDQPGQHGALASPAEVHDRAIPRGRELAEHVQVKLRLPVHPTSSRRLRRGYGGVRAGCCPEFGHADSALKSDSGQGQAVSDRFWARLPVLLTLRPLLRGPTGVGSTGPLDAITHQHPNTPAVRSTTDDTGPITRAAALTVAALGLPVATNRRSS